MRVNNLYFIASNGEHRLLAKNVSTSEVSKLIKKFLDDHNFKSYYTRTWVVDEGVVYDVGSHTEFFLWGIME